ncbi:MAG: hypothetical protein U5J62_03200 [Desulfurivibrio sp.]|nr:hypothetical protein [Desulfurivibrio sp.]
MATRSWTSSLINPQHQHLTVFDHNAGFNTAGIGRSDPLPPVCSKESRSTLDTSCSISSRMHIAFVDLGPDPQLDTDITALNGLKRIVDAGAITSAGITAGGKWYVLPHHNFGLLVVQGNQTGGGEDIGVGIGGQER